MSVKRLRWEQVENSEGTIWGQVGDLGLGGALHQGRLTLATALKTKPCPVSSPWHFPYCLPFPQHRKPRAALVNSPLAKDPSRQG